MGLIFEGISLRVQRFQENFSGRIRAITKAILLTINFKGKESLYGMINVNTKGSGRII
jgi:hypothetical protein